MHPPYSPDLAPQDFHFFPALISFLAEKKFKTDEEVKSAVLEFLRNLDGNFYIQGTEKLVLRYDKCLNLMGDYVEK